MNSYLRNPDPLRNAGSVQAQPASPKPPQSVPQGFRRGSVKVSKLATVLRRGAGGKSPSKSRATALLESFPRKTAAVPLRSPIGCYPIAYVAKVLPRGLPETPRQIRALLRCVASSTKRESRGRIHGAPPHAPLHPARPRPFALAPWLQPLRLKARASFLW